MKIALDTRTLETSHRFRGIGAYAAGLIKGLAEIDHENKYYFLTQEKPSKASCLVDKNFASDILIGNVPDSSRYYWLADQYRLPKVLKQNRIDVVHYLNQFAPPLKKTTKTVVSIHDLFGLDGRLSTKVKFWAAKRADKIVTISDFSKKELVEKAGIDGNKIVVTYCGYNPIFRPVSARSKILPEKVKRYFVYAGGFVQHEERKNIDFLIEIFEKFVAKTANDNLFLVLTGKTGAESDRIMDKARPALKEKLIFTGFFDDIAEMPKIFTGAIAMLFPSLAEGFGLPPLEAMASGTPVISSNTSSLAEVVGDGGILLNPKDLSAWVKSMEKVSTDESYRKELIRKGIAQAKKFSWEKCARETLEVYREVAK